MIEPGVTLHFVTSGSGDSTVVLPHGFPQTWREWRHIVPDLVSAGYRVVAPDYRAAGHSSRPLCGYDKRAMAGDIRLMVAYAYAQAFREEVTHLVVLDAPLPGTKVFDRLRADLRVWQFAFHGARDAPEMLVVGRERPYLQAFFDARMFDPSAIDDAELDCYASAYSAPGAMRAGFELYRAFDHDSEDNRTALIEKGKLSVPVLAVGGEESTTGPLMAEMMREVANNTTELRIPRTAHWIVEENPADFLEGLGAFLRSPSLPLAG
jgi:pimeloyl-ACP methyl ester carboxylesterase